LTIFRAVSKITLAIDPKSRRYVGASLHFPASATCFQPSNIAASRIIAYFKFAPAISKCCLLLLLDVVRGTLFNPHSSRLPTTFFRPCVMTDWEKHPEQIPLRRQFLESGLHINSLFLKTNATFTSGVSG